MYIRYGNITRVYGSTLLLFPLSVERFDIRLIQLPNY